MFESLNPHQLNLNGQDGGDSSVTDWLNQDGVQSSFDSFDRIGAIPLYPAPMAYGAAGPAYFGWGVGPASSPGRPAPDLPADARQRLRAGSGLEAVREDAPVLASADSASPSVSAVSESPPSTALLRTSAASGSSAAGSRGTVSGAASKSSFSGSSQIVSNGSSAIVFDNTYTANCTQSYVNCIVAAESQIESLFTTFNSKQDTIVVTFDEQNEGNNGIALGNSSVGHLYSYGTLESALQTAAPSDVLPADPSGGSSNWYVPDAYERMLGLNTATGSPDLSVTLNSFYNWSFGQDVINGITHELSEGGMGRIGGLGGSNSPFDNTGDWGAMDLFRYSAPGVPDYSNGRDGATTYFSNDGSTLSNQDLPNKGAPTLSFNNQYNSDGSVNNTGDTADWTQNAVWGSTGTGETLALTQTELDVLQALGWTLTLPQDVLATSGPWETQTFTNWSTGSMPIEAQDAYINGVDVSLDSNVIVNSIATSSGAILSIGSSTPTTLIAVQGTDLNSLDTGPTVSGNLGITTVYPGSALQIGKVIQTFDNAGTLGVGKGAGGGGAGTGDLNIAGTITLDGGGTVQLGESGAAGDILNAPDGKGGTVNGDLVNVDNTIKTVSGSSGLIDLGLGFDNQASGKVESFSFLQIIAPSVTNEGAMIAEAGASLDVSDGGGGVTFTNSGTMTADSGATLDLGGDGASETLTNTGTIEILGNANLAISGKLTVTGSGAIALTGAGAAITSDGLPTTFTNDSSIDVAASGRIGDGDLTFVNDGTVGTTVSGVTLTISTGGNTVTNGSNGLIEAGTSPSSSFGATTGTVDLGQDGGTGSMNNAGAIAIFANSDLAISGNYAITGSGTIQFKGAGADITSDGKALARFTNASTIEAFASGQIGDKGIHTNDLTFDNSGTAGPSGSGVTLTINTGGNTVLNTGTLVAANRGILAIISNVNNQGTISAGTSPSSSQGATTGTVDLGSDGGTGSTANSGSGAIDVWGGSDLAISGAYTVTGGSIGMKGAGADITSDGKAAATLTNASTINALASGQIGDEGIKASNDLTFVNKGTVLADGSGVTLTLNTGGNTINDGGGTLEAENGATLAIDSNVDTGVASGTAGTIDAASGGTVILSAKVADGVLGPSVPGQVKIDGGVFDMLFGSSVTVPIEFTSKGGTLEIFGVAVKSVGGAPPKVSTATFGADKAVLDEIVGGFAISDTAAHISADLNNLTDPLITSITISDNAPVGVSVSQLTSDAAQIGKLVNANATPYKLAVTDTLPTIVGDLAVLNADSHIASLSATSGSATLSGGVGITAPAFSLLNSGTTLTLAENLTYGGAFTEGAGSTISISSADTLTLTGASTLAGTISGAGALTLGGGTVAINAGANLTVAKLTLSGAATKVTLNENLSYAGTFTEAGATLSLAGGNLTLSGADGFAGGTVGGSKVLNADGTTKVSGLTIGGTATFDNAATLTESSGAVTLGDASLSAAKLLNASTGIWDITDDSGIGLGASALSAITNNGLFEKTGGAGTSKIAPAFANAHDILVSSGALDFKGAVTGTGTDAISGPATIEFDSTIGANQAINYSGASLGTLDLADPLGYAGSHIGNFLKGDKVDLAGAWSLLSFSENGPHTLGTLTLASGASHVALEFAGNFVKTDFSITTGTTTIIGHT